MIELTIPLLIGLLAVAAAIYFSLNPRPIQRLLKRFWVWRLRHNKRFMAGVRRGLDAYHQGKCRPWSEVKEELGLITPADLFNLIARAETLDDIKKLYAKYAQPINNTFGTGAMLIQKITDIELRNLERRVVKIEEQLNGCQKD